jgi:crossover junction endodeoxyribonuclease RuvC
MKFCLLQLLFSKMPLDIQHSFLYAHCMKILGIDPGLQRAGWGVIEQNGSSLKFIACGVLKSNSQDNLARRLSELHQGFCGVIEIHKPDEVAMEETFVNRNPASALKLGQARGAALAVPGLYNIPVFEYAANTVKKAVVGAGHADKTQIAHMVRLLLPACGTMGADAADALAVAICHANRSGSAQRRDQRLSS